MPLGRDPDQKLRVARCQELVARPGMLPPSLRREAMEIGRDARGCVLRKMRLTRLLPYHGLGLKDASEGIWSGKRGPDLL